MVTGLTDSQVASQVLGREMTTAFPLCLVAMEAAAQLEARGLSLDLLWVPRGVNQEADALSNLRFEGFSEKHRVNLDLQKLPFMVLPDLIDEALHFYSQQGGKRGSDGALMHKRKRRKSEPLRVRDPW